MKTAYVKGKPPDPRLRLSNPNPTKMNKPKQTQEQKAHRPSLAIKTSFAQHTPLVNNDPLSGKMQTPNTKRHRSPEQDMDANKKPKAWDLLCFPFRTNSALVVPAHHALFSL